LYSARLPDIIKKKRIIIKYWRNES